MTKRQVYFRVRYQETSNRVSSFFCKAYKPSEVIPGLIVFSELSPPYEPSPIIHDPTYEEAQEFLSKVKSLSIPQHRILEVLETPIQSEAEVSHRMGTVTVLTTVK